MGHEHAKVLAMLLRRQLKVYEDELGSQIKVMPKLMNTLGLSDEDWDKI